MESVPHNAPLELDEPLRQRISEIAHAKGLSANRVIQQAIEQFVAANREIQRGSSDSLLEFMDELCAKVPDEALAGIPRDLAKNFHHYRHGYGLEE